MCSDLPQKLSEATAEEELLADLKLDDLDVVATLGMGGFGRVDLVKWNRDQTRVFALKSCSKTFIRITQQQQHVNNEKIVSLQNIRQRVIIQ